MFSLFLREKVIVLLQYKSIKITLQTSQLYIGEACWAFIFGVVIGPYGANIFNPRDWSSNESTLNTITLEVTRIVLAIGVFAIGVELPKQYMKKHWQSLFFLLVPIMTWVSIQPLSSFLMNNNIYIISSGLVCLCGFDIFSYTGSIVPLFTSSRCLFNTYRPDSRSCRYWRKVCRQTRSRTPSPSYVLCLPFLSFHPHVANIVWTVLAAESGCNDGAAFPFLFIALYLTLQKSDARAVEDWFLITILCLYPST